MNRLEHLKRQLKAREGNPAMARSCEAIKEQIAAIEAAAAAEEGEATDE